jgi:DNA topoisomerase-1
MSAYWKTLSHNGVNFPDQYQPDGLAVLFRGNRVPLSPLAEEMAYQLAKKKDTPYVQDPVFTSNFMDDLVKQLPPWCKDARFADLDFSELYRKVDGEKAAKESMSKEQKKALAVSRKERREGLKAKYGRAVLDGKELDIANWMVEPPGLFMGRGCLAADTIVKTENGVKYVQEVERGDAIAVHYGSNDMFYKPVAAVAQQGIRPVFMLRTRTHSIRATDNHPFLTLKVNRSRVRNENGTYASSRYPAALAWKSISELEVGDYVVTVKRYQILGSRRFSNVPRRTVGGMIVTPKLARVLGYYLGDGFTERRQNGDNSHVGFSEGHPVLAERYSKLCEEAFGIAPVVRNRVGGNSVVLSIYSREIADVIESLGFHKPALEKRVPEWVFDLADDLKVAFIRGYLDADGNFFKRKIDDVEYGSFGFESTNKRLIEDLRELATCAGLQVSNLTHRDNHGYTEGLNYRFFISEYASVNRLLGPNEELKGERTRMYSLSNRSNNLRKKWDWSRLHVLDSNLFALERVLEIVPGGTSMTFDVSMADKKNPNFIANGFVAHNSHPLRGHWKPRVQASDVILNLGESAPAPPGDWKAIVHDHNSMWMAKWVDKLTDKEKYVWLHESSPIQQSRSKAKYDNARKVGANLQKIRSRILRDLDSKDERVRQVATVCYLIDTLGMRVGDEKDEDEADTVGASTLRVEHVGLKGSLAEFNFLGKDSVAWKKSEALPPSVARNLTEFTAGKGPEDLIFHNVSSGLVNQFLSSILPGLTAKVFRTYHATAKAREVLVSNDLRNADDLDKLYHAKEANLQAAIFCNHQRTPPKTWQESLNKKQGKLEEAMARKDAKRVAKLKKELEFFARTKNYNLNTAMKNYIDPRVFKSWCDYVGLDWAKVYSKSLQKKFSWVIQSAPKWEPEAVSPLRPLASSRRQGDNPP